MMVMELSAVHALSSIVMMSISISPLCTQVLGYLFLFHPVGASFVPIGESTINNRLFKELGKNLTSFPSLLLISSLQSLKETFNPSYLDLGGESLSIDVKRTGGETMTMMKAVLIHSYGGPEVLVYEDAPKPEPAEGEVLIRVHAAGVNPLDWKVRQGYMKHRLPMTPGWDVSGVVEAACSGVTELKPGDEVFGLLDITSYEGAYAEYAAARAQDMARKPKKLDHVHAAALPIAALAAWQALFEQAGLSSGQTILIHAGAGGVGHFAVQLAKWKGAHVTSTASLNDASFVKDLGADKVIDYQAAKFEDIAHDMDVVLDLIGGDTQERSWGVLKKGGALVSTVGISSPETWTKLGVQGKAFRVHPDAGQLERIAELIVTGKLKTVIHSVLPLADARKAHELLQSGRIHGKVVLKVRE
jgi:NADPH:quinone reductase-like Zn-dependent oxidoreductase